MHDYDVNIARYPNCEIHGTWIRGSGLRTGLTWPYCEKVLNFIKSSLLPYIFEKNYMHGYDVYKPCIVKAF